MYVLLHFFVKQKDNRKTGPGRYYHCQSFRKPYFVFFAAADSAQQLEISGSGRNF